MRKDAFALQIRNEARYIGIVAAHAQSGDSKNQNENERHVGSNFRVR
jgi:hypothetical protein